MDLEQHTIAKHWTEDSRKAYLAFSARLMKSEPLTVEIGSSGMSFYKQTQRGRSDLGFADFRVDSFEGRLNVTAALRAIRKAVTPDTQIKGGKVWHSLHFPFVRAQSIADVFATNIVAKVK